MLQCITIDDSGVLDFIIEILLGAALDYFLGVEDVQLGVRHVTLCSYPLLS